MRIINLADIRSKVKAEIERLLEEDIIEEVHGPTEWLSPVVVVPQPNSDSEDICFRVDMRKPNVAIQRTRHITPTLDELITNMKNSKVFSKIDLENGYHRFQTTQPTRGGAVTADSSCCANCVESPRPQKWGPDLPFFGHAGHADPLDGWRCCSQKRVMSRPIQVRQL